MLTTVFLKWRVTILIYKSSHLNSEAIFNLSCGKIAKLLKTNFLRQQEH